VPAAERTKARPRAEHRNRHFLSPQKVSKS
jgi:hypothetical protein